MPEFYTNYLSQGENILVKGYSENGEVFLRKFKAAPILYEPTSPGSASHTSVNGTPLVPRSFDTVAEYRDYLNIAKAKGIEELCGFTSHAFPYILDTYGTDDVPYERNQIRVVFYDIEVISKTVFPKPEDADFPVVSITVYDSKDDVYYVFYYNENGSEWAVGRSSLTENFFVPSDILSKIKIFKRKNERDVITAFIGLIAKLAPDVISGWNSEAFDNLYIYNRCEKLGIPVSQLSPWKRVSKLKLRNIDEGYKVAFSGMAAIDYLSLYKKYESMQPSYKLGEIANSELGVSKLDYEGSLADLWENDIQRFIDYNIQDVVLLMLLEKKKKLFDLLFSVAYMTSSNYEQILGTVAVWENKIAKDLISKNIVPPLRRDTYNTAPIPGAYVMEPKVGLHEWVVSFDVQSLYPHIFMQYNLSSETIVLKKREQVDIDQAVASKKDWSSVLEKNECITGAGFFFRTDKEGILPHQMKTVFSQRKETKQKMLEAKKTLQKMKESGKDKNIIEEYSKEIERLDLRQQTLKLLINSLYGSTLAPSFLYFDPRVGESTTLSGQLIIKTGGEYINNWLNTILKTDNIDYRILGDTDSVMFSFDTIVRRFINPKGTLDQKQIVAALDKFCEDKIVPLFKDCYEDLAVRMGCPKSYIVMVRDVIASRLFTVSKKHYAAYVLNQEGVDLTESPKMKIMGLEAVKSSSAKMLQNAMKEMIKLILTTDENSCRSYFKQFKKEFMEMPLEKIASPRSFNNISKYLVYQTPSKTDMMTLKDVSLQCSHLWAKGTPSHIKAAIVYNHLLKVYGIESRFSPIMDGNKGLFIQLKPRNPLESNVIGFVDRLPSEFNIDKYIDKDAQFEKTYAKPIRDIFEAIHWQLEQKDTGSLTDLFS